MNFKESIKNQIKDLEKKPRAIFVLQNTMWLLLFLLIFLGGVVMTGLFWSRMRLLRPLLFLTLGLRGLSPFMVSFPWLFLIVSLVSILAIYVLSTQKGPFYKKPLFVSLVVFLLFMILSGLALSSHPKFKRAHPHNLPRVEEGVIDNSHIRLRDGEMINVPEGHFQRGERVRVFLPGPMRVQRLK